MNAPVARKHPIGSSSRQQDRAAARAARTSASRLTGCLAAGVGAGIVGTAPAEAGIVQIDIGLSGFNIGGINGGVTAETYATTSNFPLTPDRFGSRMGIKAFFGACLGSTVWSLLRQQPMRHPRSSRQDSRLAGLRRFSRVTIRLHSA